MQREEIIAGARSVLTIGQHLKELQQQTLEMPNTAEAEARGYLTPSEDEAARHLLVSYWQSRSALLETVYSFRQNAPPTGVERCPAFIVAFAGALILIDAARFMREQFHHLYVLRAKLNEPEPHFGIPAGVYDSVQASLTNPLNAWQLYYALQFWNSMQGELRSLGKEPLFGELLDLIDRQYNRLSASIEQLATARVRLRTRQAWTILKGDLLHTALYGIQKFIGSAMVGVFVKSGHCPQMPPQVVEALRKLLEPGDVMVVRKEFAISNYFLPGFWPHAALFLGTEDRLRMLGLDQQPGVLSKWGKLSPKGGEDPLRVLEATRDGVLVRSLASPFGSDAIVVMRPFLEREQIAQGLARGLFHEGKPYDFDFDFSRSDRLVCSEVVYRSYEGIGPMRFNLTPRAGRFTLSPEDLVNMAVRKEGFQTIATYCRQYAESLQVGAAAEAIVRKTLCNKDHREGNTHQ